MSKKLLTLFVILALLVGLTSCGATMLGKWKIVEISAGDMVMDQDDMESMGLDPGYIKINKSGSCELNLLGDEYEGTWSGSEETQLDFSYGGEFTATATIDNGTMDFTDSQGNIYTLKK